jgi:outer membrane protein
VDSLVRESAGIVEAELHVADVTLNVTTAYLQILYSMEAVDISSNQLEVIINQIERTAALVKSGALNNAALLDIKSQFALEELNLTNAQNKLNLSYLSLAQLLNLPSEEGLLIEKPNLNIQPDLLLVASSSQIYNTAIGFLPEIKVAEDNSKSASKAIGIAWGGLSPRLSVGASYGTGYSGLSKRVIGGSPMDPILQTIPYFDQYKQNVNKSFGFYLTVPIFNRFQIKTQIDKARIQKFSADLNMEATKQQVQKNIQQAYGDADAGIKRYNASLKAVEASNEVFKYSEQKFNLGLLNSIDYDNSRNKLIKAQSDLLQAKYEFLFKIKILEFIVHFVRTGFHSASAAVH